MRYPAFAALSAVVLAVGCSGPASVQAARAEVDKFHNQFNANNYEAIWNESAQDIQSTVSKEQFIAGLDNLHKYWGNAVSTKQTAWHYSTNNNGSFSQVTMETDFEKGRAYEQFTYRNFGEMQKLAGYNINKTPPPSNSASASASASPD